VSSTVEFDVDQWFGRAPIHGGVRSETNRQAAKPPEDKHQISSSSGVCGALAVVLERRSSLSTITLMVELDVDQLFGRAPIHGGVRSETNRQAAKPPEETSDLFFFWRLRRLGG